eukprot:Pompholyxophrys_punicea_v1_NODE_322_length_2246_cov_5.801728.p1 type:complete len:377 gc:universal NODE_322_length_2246_cov_5.801728:901-2031(+)
MKKQPGISVEYGINFLSVLNDCPYFDLCVCMPHDVMHVVLEGTFDAELNLFLKYCILEKRFFSVELFNNRLASFNYEGDTVCKPAPLKEISATRKKFSKQTASGQWVLARILPFLINDLVEVNDEKYSCLRMHIYLISLLMKYSYTDFDIYLVRETVAKHHKIFRKVYPDKQITPKMHYLVHFASMIRAFGPPRLLWCMRFESRHKYFKDIGTISNWINLPYSLSTRNQLWVCNLYNEQSSNQLFPTVSFGSRVRACSVQEIEALKLEVPCTSDFFQVNSCTVYRQNFAPGVVLRLKYEYESDWSRVYTVLESIYCHRNSIWFSIRPVQVVYCFEFCAFKIIFRSEHVKVLSSEQFCLHSVNRMWKVGDKIFIADR